MMLSLFLLGAAEKFNVVYCRLRVCNLEQIRNLQNTTESFVELDFWKNYDYLSYVFYIQVSGEASVICA